MREQVLVFDNLLNDFNFFFNKFLLVFLLFHLYFLVIKLGYLKKINLYLTLTN